VAQSLVERQFVEYNQHKYMMKLPEMTVAEESVADKADEDDDDEAGYCERSILVIDVPDTLAEAVECLVESEKKGGGAVELRRRDNYTGAMLFVFLSKDGQ